MGFGLWAERACSAGLPPVISVQGRNWAMNMGSDGYADVALDLRDGFEGREYLSGEWGGAIDYEGAPMPMWLPRNMIFPDWETNSDLEIEEAIGIADPQNPFNKDGNLVFRSTIANSLLRITQWYEICDSGQGMAQGQSGSNGGGAVEPIMSDPDVFRQRIQFTNISDQVLSGLSYYHLVHGLESETAVYDDEDYGGPFGDYHYDFSLRGLSFSFHTGTGEIWEHDDIFTLNAEDPPAAVQVGYYGVKGVDRHDVGRPATGLHQMIEMRSLDGTTQFEPPEGGYVAGAARWDLGDIEPEGSAEIVLLASLRTFSTRSRGPIELMVDNPWVMGDSVRIEFRDRENLRDTYDFGFLLYKNRMVEGFDPGDPDSGWEQVGVPFTIDGGDPGRYWFDAPYDPEERDLFYIIRPVFSTF